MLSDNRYRLLMYDLWLVEDLEFSLNQRKGILFLCCEWGGLWEMEGLVKSILFSNCLNPKSSDPGAEHSHAYPLSPPLIPTSPSVSALAGKVLYPPHVSELALGPLPARWEIWVWSLSGAGGTQPPTFGPNETQYTFKMQPEAEITTWDKGCPPLFGREHSPCPSWTLSISHISRPVSTVSAGLAQGISCPATTKVILAAILQHSVHVFTSLGLEVTAVLLYWSGRPQWKIHLSV